MLPRDAWVVRGGTLQVSDLERACETTSSAAQRPGVSVFAADVGSRLALLEAVPRMPHQMVSFTKIGRLLDAGFEVEQTYDPPHHTVWFPATDLHTSILRFRSTFEAPIDRAELLKGASQGNG
jgi:hypothetical protein